MPPANRVQPVGDQESVWDYPRPPRLERVPETLRVIFNSVEIANSNKAYRVLETSHPPTYYIPQDDVKMEEYFTKIPSKSSFCEWKGAATYFKLNVNGKVASGAAWCYEQPTSGFREIAGYLSFYASQMDDCFVGEERVQAQAGDFYGGWITSKIVGPFKGGAGTWGW